MNPDREKIAREVSEQVYEWIRTVGSTCHVERLNTPTIRGTFEQTMVVTLKVDGYTTPVEALPLRKRQTEQDFEL